MNIGVFGATGATGRHFVKLAIENGHTLRVLVRTPKKLSAQPQLEVMVGDARHADHVRQVIAETEAVFCALGNGASPAQSDIRQQGTRCIVAALADVQAKPHVVILSSLGVGDSKQQMRLPVRWIVPYILRHPIADHAAQESIIMQSGLPWTILRPTALTDDSPTGNLHVSTPPQKINAHPGLPRADVAAFALQTIENHQHLHQSLTLTTPTR
ncbi:MAG: SDR family oxidoreductase [Chloroflexi bacterium]|nr:SDR family oxidoreductase [Chloroflexota bacterium]